MVTARFLLLASETPDKIQRRTRPAGGFRHLTVLTRGFLVVNHLVGDIRNIERDKTNARSVH